MIAASAYINCEELSFSFVPGTDGPRPRLFSERENGGAIDRPTEKETPTDLIKSSILWLCSSAIRQQQGRLISIIIKPLFLVQVFWRTRIIPLVVR